MDLLWSGYHVNCDRGLGDGTHLCLVPHSVALTVDGMMSPPLVLDHPLAQFISCHGFVSGGLFDQVPFLMAPVLRPFRRISAISALGVALMAQCLSDSPEDHKCSLVQLAFVTGHCPRTFIPAREGSFCPLYMTGFSPHSATS